MKKPSTGMLIILAAFLVSGCGRDLTNDQIIQETHKCQQAGLNANHYFDGNENEHVKCEPKP